MVSNARQLADLAGNVIGQDHLHYKGENLLIGKNAIQSVKDDISVHGGVSFNLSNRITKLIKSLVIPAGVKTYMRLNDFYNDFIFSGEISINKERHKISLQNGNGYFSVSEFTSQFSKVSMRLVSFTYKDLPYYGIEFENSSITDITLSLNVLTNSALILGLKEIAAITGDSDDLYLEDMAPGSDVLYGFEQPESPNTVFLITVAELTDIKYVGAQRTVFTTITNFPVPITENSLVTLSDGTVLSFGGTLKIEPNGLAVCTNAVFQYNALSDTWSQVASLPVQVKNLKSFLLADGTVLLVGGLKRYNETDYVSNYNFYRYNPVTNLFSIDYEFSLPNTVISNSPLSVAETDNTASIMFGIQGTTFVYKYNTATRVATATTNSIVQPVNFDWLLKSIEPNEFFQSIAYGNGVYVLPSYSSGLIFTSTDTINWTSQSVGTGLHHTDVIFAGGQFIVIGSTGSIFTSPNGLIWTQRTSNTTVQLYSITHSGSLYLAVGFNSTTVRSPDGITWTVVAGSSNIMWAAAYGNGLFVIGGTNGLIQSSPDGITWTVRQAAGGGAQVLCIKYLGSSFIAVGELGKIWTSPNGITWTLKATVSTVGSLWGVVYVNGYYLVTGANGIAISTDTVNWSVRNITNGTQLLDIINLDGFLSAVGANGVIATIDMRVFLDTNLQNFGFVCNNKLITASSGLYNAVQNDYVMEYDLTANTWKIADSSSFPVSDVFLSVQDMLNAEYNAFKYIGNGSYMILGPSIRNQSDALFEFATVRNTAKRIVIYNGSNKTWESKSNLSIVPYGYDLTRLKDGRVLITASEVTRYNGTITFAPKAIVYDAYIDTLKTTDGSVFFSSGDTALPYKVDYYGDIAAGKDFFFGGIYNSKHLVANEIGTLSNKCYSYDPATGFVARANSPIALMKPKVLSLVNSKSLIFGFVTNTAGAASNNVFEYFDTTNIWTELSPMPFATSELVAFVESSTSIIAIAYNPIPDKMYFLRYNRTSNTWSSTLLNSLPSIKQLQVIKVDNTLYAFAGKLTATNEPNLDTYKVDVTTLATSVESNANKIYSSFARTGLDEVRTWKLVSGSKYFTITKNFDNSKSCWLLDLAVSPKTVKEVMRSSLDSIDQTTYMPNGSVSNGKIKYTTTENQFEIKPLPYKLSGKTVAYGNSLSTSAAQKAPVNAGSILLDSGHIISVGGSDILQSVNSMNITSLSPVDNYKTNIPIFTLPQSIYRPAIVKISPLSFMIVGGTYNTAVGAITGSTTVSKFTLTVDGNNNITNVTKTDMGAYPIPICGGMGGNLPDGSPIVVGGVTGTPTAPVWTKKAYRYNIANNTWVPIADAPRYTFTRGGMSNIIQLVNGKMLVINASSDINWPSTQNNILSQKFLGLIEYDPVTNTWKDYSALNNLFIPEMDFFTSAPGPISTGAVLLDDYTIMIFGASVYTILDLTTLSFSPLKRISQDLTKIMFATSAFKLPNNTVLFAGCCQRIPYATVDKSYLMV